MNSDTTNGSTPSKESLKRVLVIDDNPDIYELISRTVNGTEFLVSGASDGRQGIQAAREYKPDVILLDIMMPKFDGFTTGKVLKRNPETKEIPIIFLSGKRTKNDITAAIEAGGSDYIVKPFRPHDLLTRMRSLLKTQEIEQKRNNRQSEISTETEPQKESSEYVSVTQEIKSFARFGDIIVCPLLTSTIILDNYNIYRSVFVNLVSDGFFKIVLDAGRIEKIDGSGLALLVSINEALKSYSGELKIVLPEQETYQQLSNVKLNDIFDCYDSVQMAVDSYSNQESKNVPALQEESKNVCMICNNINDDNSRFCKFCGINLVINRSNIILDVIRRIISHRISQETSGYGADRFVKSQESLAEEDILSEFNIEIIDGSVRIQYQTQLSDKSHFKAKNEIGIHMPCFGNSPISVQPGMKISMNSTATGSFAVYDTIITRIDEIKGIVFVRYTDEAKIIHSQKNFSVAPNFPISINLTCPSFNFTGGIAEGKILELSRARIIVLSDRQIPENECLSLSFRLPDGFEVSSPLVIAKKRKEKFLYDIEFALIDEREQTKLIQYMYRRQIELAKSFETR